MTNEEIFKKLEAFAEKRRDDCYQIGEILDTRYWVGYIDGLRRLYEKITDKEVAKVTTNFEKIKSMTLEEMVESQYPFHICPCGDNDRCTKYVDCDVCVREWLKQEVKE